MEWRELPPLTALRAFAAFAQTRSVIAAGDALGVSHAAISQQLRVLETHMDATLLDRSGRSLSLTADGLLLADGLREGFEAIGDAVSQISAARADRPLHITTTPTFAAAWLMPRLPGFRAEHGDIDIMIDPTVRVVTLGSEGAEVAIRYGTGSWPGLEAQKVILSSMVIVAAPTLVGNNDAPDADMIAALPWLEEAGRSEATRWLEAQGLLKKRGPLVQLPGNLLLDAARDGQGVAVTVRSFVESDIASGRLRVLREQHMEGAGYYILTRPGVLRPVLKDFVAWVRREGRAAMPSPGRPSDR